MRNTLLALVTLLQLAPSHLFGQGKEMFIEQIAGKKIVRKDFGKSGEQKGKQVFTIGELERKDNIYEVAVVVKFYDIENELEKKYTTSYKCNPYEFDVLVNVFPFSDPNDAKIKVDVTSKDFQQLYELNGQERLKDIHLKMSVESGVLNFFGSKNLVTLKDREKKMENGEIKVTSTVIIEAYLMGLKIKTIRYSVEEYLTWGFVLKQQTFKAKNGSYFTMNYKFND